MDQYSSDLAEGTSVQSNSFDLAEGTSVQSRGKILWSVLKSALKKDAKKKMGPKVEKKIGDDFDKKVWPTIEREAKKGYDKYGYSKRVGPVSSTAPNGIKQGEHIFELYGNDGNYCLRFHVFKNQSGNTTNWHYHTKDDWSDHKGNIKLYHDSLPKWGSK